MNLYADAFLASLACRLDRNVQGNAMYDASINQCLHAALDKSHGYKVNKASMQKRRRDGRVSPPL